MTPTKFPAGTPIPTAPKALPAGSYTATSLAAKAQAAAEAAAALPAGPYILLWAGAGVAAELAARPDATAEPLSQRTVIEVTTAGHGPLVGSIKVVKPGPVAATIKKDNVDVEVS